MFVGILSQSTVVFAGPERGFDIAVPGMPALTHQVSMVVPYNIDVATPRPDRKPEDRAPARRPSAKAEGPVTLQSQGTLGSSPRAVSNSNFDQGIFAYRKGQLKTALRAFVKTADNKKANAFERAAGAFWAGRVAERMNKFHEANQFFAIAAQYDRTFYGQLAHERLGLATDLTWARPQPDLAAMSRLQNENLGRLAVDHVGAGRLSAADRALADLSSTADKELRVAILAFALHHGLPATAMKLAGRVEKDTGIRYDAAFYPVGGWIKAEDFRVDRALVHAIIRQESNFNPKAKSNMGAVGLMQLLPSTANYVIKVKAGGPKDRDLTRSLENLKVGQHYVEYLLEHGTVNGDVIKLLVAYNAGPGNLAKWERDLGDNVAADPLLFIETIPAAETRAYVEKVMAAYWIYRDQFGMNNPTRAATAYAQPAMLDGGAQNGLFAGLNLKRMVGM